MSVRTYLLAAGTSDFVVSGVLLDVSGKLGVSLTAAGQLATAFAIAYVIGAPLLRLLVGAVGTFVSGLVIFGARKAEVLHG